MVGTVVQKNTDGYSHKTSMHAHEHIIMHAHVRANLHVRSPSSQGQTPK